MISMNINESTAELLPECPRCGYDQRGATAQWGDACPLHGTCAECGLQLHWAEIMRPDKFEPRWCVEFTPRPSNVPLASLKTAVRTFLPWRFWKLVRMAYPVRARRLAVYMCLLVIAIILAHGLQQSALAYRVWAMFNQQLTAAFARSLPGAQLNAQIIDLQQQLAQQREQVAIIDQWANDKRISERVDLIQMRANAIITIDVMQDDIAKLQSQLQAAQAKPRQVPPSVPLGGELLRALLTPWSAKPGPIVTVGGATYQYPAPAELSSSLGGFGSQFSQSIGWVMLGGAWVWWSPFVLIPLGFILLPISRKRARVRWSHLGRVFAYSALIPAAACIVYTVSCAVTLMLPPLELLSNLLMIIAMVSVPIALVIWWSAAIHKYLLIPHPFGVAFLLAVLAVVLSFTVFMYVSLRMTAADFWRFLDSS